MKRYLLPFLVFPSIVSAGPSVLAKCIFNQECIVGESCEETNYIATVYESNNAPFTMETVSENITGVFFVTKDADGTSTLYGHSAGAEHLLTIAENGDARYSVQMDGPMLISYLGNCQVAE